MYRRHVLTLVFRVLLFTAALCLYFIDAGKLDFTAAFEQGSSGLFLAVIWSVLVVSMMFRLFPNKHIAMGARKHYACSYRAAPCAENASKSISEARKHLNKGALFSTMAWILLNAAVFFVLSALGKLKPPEIVLVMLAYAICDTVCVMFFCPFQLLFMRNRCCVVCRIYNWDFLMMCSPMVIFRSAFSLSLLLLSAVVLVRWEVSLHKNPRYFLEESNENLSCAQCQDRMCRTQCTSKCGK